MNTFLNGLKNATDFHYTENGALSHSTTGSAVYDMFSLGGAYRGRSEEDVILLFRKAMAENETYALKCLFYLRDILEGQGERRFFRLCLKDLARTNADAAIRNIRNIPRLGRWDDLYVLVGTSAESAMFNFIKEQLALDVQSKTPSLLAKWLKSENTSSSESRYLGNKTRIALNMSHKQYRKTLSILRERINVLERLMSANKWDEIEFDKIPSRAGMIYRNAFARHDIERMKSEKSVVSYADFAKDETAKVNAKALYPYECVAEALKLFRTGSYYSMRTLPSMEDTQRLMVNKYWDNMKNFIGDKPFNALAMVDTSGSMVRDDASAPINVAISLGLYCAERANGPFKGHYISFASRPQLIATDGVDFCDKVQRIYKTNLVDNTNLTAAFDMILNTAISTRCKQEDIPEQIIVISDMEIDQGCGHGCSCDGKTLTEMEAIHKKWNAMGYKMPKLVYWNVDARQDNILDASPYVTCVSGCSPSIFESIITGKTGISLMMDKLNSKRYEAIQ
jgi:hypothetical protein